MAANPTIQLKRKVTSGAPASLAIGEPAVNTADNQLYIGVNSSGIKWIGAEIENSATNGTTWSSDLKLATKKAIGDFFAAKSGTTFTGDITLSGGSDIRFVETGGGTDYVAIQAPSVVSAGNVTLTLPGSYAAADGYVLSSTTGGTLSWISAGTASSVSVTETSANSSFNLVLTNATSTTSASIFIDSDDNVSYNPSTNLLTLGGDLAVNGGDITTTTTGTANIFNTNASAVYVGGAATDVVLGSTSSTVTVNGTALVCTTTGTFTIAGTNPSQVEIGLNASSVRLGAIGGTVLTYGDLTVGGGDITTTLTTASVFNSNVTTLNIGQAATQLIMSATSGTTTIRNDLTVKGVILSSSSTGEIFNSGSSTVKLGEAATSISIGSTSGTTTINSANTVVTGDLAVNGGDITTTFTGTSKIFNDATSLEVGKAATSVSIGSTSATVSIGNLSAVGDIAVNGGDITTTVTGLSTIFNENTTSLEVGRAATSVSIGSNGATISIGNLSAGGDIAVNGGDITTTVTGTATVFNATAATVNVGGAATNMTLGDATSSTITLRGGTLVGNTATQNVFDTTATTVNAFGAAVNCTIGHDGTSNSTTNIATGTTAAAGLKTVNLGTNGNATATVNINIGTTGQGTCQINSPSTDLNGDLTVRGGDIITNQTSFNLLNTTVTSLSIGGSSTSVSIGAATGTTTINNANTVVTGDLAVNGADITTTTTGTATLFNSNATTVNIGGAAINMTLGASNATINLGGGTTGATVVIKGNLQVDGATTTINSTTLTVDDKLIELAHSPSGAVGNDAAVDGGGIQLNSSQGNKTFTWVDSTDAWTSSEHLNLASGKAYYINGTSVLNATTLGSTVTGSSLTQVGTVTLGTWNGTTIGVGYGGTGLTTYTTGQILYASAASTLAGLTASSTAGAVVSSTGAGTAPEYKTISVTNGTVTPGSGTLTLAIQDASADGSTKGLATFNATQFDSASGVITLDTIDGGTYA